MALNHRKAFHRAYEKDNEYPLFIINDFADVMDYNGFASWLQTLEEDQQLFWLAKVLGYGSKYLPDGYMEKVSHDLKPPNILVEHMNQSIDNHRVVMINDKLTEVIRNSIKLDREGTIRFSFGWYAKNDNWRKFYDRN